jgi:hypothetical protein
MKLPAVSLKHAYCEGGVSSLHDDCIHHFFTGLQLRQQMSLII